MNKEEIVKKMIEKIKNLPIGTETSTSSLLAEVFGAKESESNNAGMYAYGDFEFTTKEMFEINALLNEKAKENNIILDASKWDGQIIGLPFHITFIIKQL